MSVNIRSTIVNRRPKCDYFDQPGQADERWRSPKVPMKAMMPNVGLPREEARAAPDSDKAERCVERHRREIGNDGNDELDLEKPARERCQAESG